MRQPQKAQAALPEYRIVSNQVRCSLIERTIASGLLECRLQNAITVLAFSPFGSGLAQIRAADSEGVLARIAATTAKTGDHVALNWVISKNNVIAVSKGSTADRVLESCGASGWRLSPDALDLLDRTIRFRQRGRTESALRRLARLRRQMSGREIGSTSASASTSANVPPRLGRPFIYTNQPQCYIGSSIDVWFHQFRGGLLATP